jgi:hypothetical protein
VAADLIGRPEAGLSCLRLEQNEFPAQALSLRREIFGDALPRVSNAVANLYWLAENKKTGANRRLVSVIDDV